MVNSECFRWRIVVPKVPSFKIKELAKLMGPECKIKIIGKRLGKKFMKN